MYRDSGDFLKKIKQIENFLKNSILVTVNVVGIYPSILHELALEALEEALGKR